MRMGRFLLLGLAFLGLSACADMRSPSAGGTVTAHTGPTYDGGPCYF